MPVWQAAGKRVAHAQACLRRWFGSMPVGVMLHSIRMLSSVVRTCVSQRRWRMLAFAVAMLAPTISLQPTPLSGPQDRPYFGKRFLVLSMWLSQGRG